MTLKPEDRRDICEECSQPATILILCPDHYIDKIVCRSDAIKWLVETNNDQPNYDEASASAALDSMLIEGSAVSLTQ